MEDQQIFLAENSDIVLTKALPQLVSQQKHLIIESGENAFTCDDTIRYFYFILSGKIKISQVNIESSKEQTIQLLGRGDMFDVVTLLDRGYHEYVATALERSEIVQVPIEHVREKIDNDPEFNRFFFPYLGRQIRQMETLAVDLSLYDVYKRLLRLIARNIKHSGEGTHLGLINDLSHQELAALVGTVRKVLNRNLQKLKQEGIIDISRKKITLKDLKALFDRLQY